MKKLSAKDCFNHYTKKYFFFLYLYILIIFRSVHLHRRRPTASHLETGKLGSLARSSNERPNPSQANPIGSIPIQIRSSPDKPSKTGPGPRQLARVVVLVQRRRRIVQALAQSLAEIQEIFKNQIGH